MRFALSQVRSLACRPQATADIGFNSSRTVMVTSQPSVVCVGDGKSLGYHTSSVGYKDKSTQTELVVMGDSRLIEANADSLPQLPNHEISQIISDAIDNLPPGSLLPLEESMFAPGSKRNLECKAALKTQMASLTNRKAKDSGSYNPQRSTEASKSDQNGFTFSNRFSSLADPPKQERSSQVTSKSLIGPGLYARSVRPGVPKDVDSENVKGHIHTYSPGPGVVLTFESVDKPSPSKNGAKEAEQPRASSFTHPSTSNDLAGTRPSSQETHLPPHLRIGQSSDPVKPEKSSISESTQIGSSKASHLEDHAMREVTFHTTPVIKSVKVEEKSSSSFVSSNAPAVKLVASEGKGPSSPHLIKESQSNGSSPNTEKLPPHLRNAEPQKTLDVTLSALNKASRSSSEQVDPNLKDALFFKVWPKSEPRDTPGSFSSILTRAVRVTYVTVAAEIRKVIIKNLPFNATPSFVTSIVFGGALEQIQINGKTASVVFLNAKYCQNFYEKTANGLAYSFEGQKGTVLVDKALDVDVLSGQVRTYIELGFTRCVRAIGIGSDMTVEILREKAAERNKSVEDVFVGTTETNVSMDLPQLPTRFWLTEAKN